jgi:hypothetical protein
VVTDVATSMRTRTSVVGDSPDHHGGKDPGRMRAALRPAIAPHLVFEAFMTSTVLEQAIQRPQICPAIRVSCDSAGNATATSVGTESAGFLA